MAPPKGWLDIHGHFLPHDSAADRHAYAAGCRALHFHVADDWSWDVGTDTLAYLDAAGVQMQMLSSSGVVPAGDPAALRAANDRGAALVAAHPDRFGLLAALPTGAGPAACLAEIERLYGRASATAAPVATAGSDNNNNNSNNSYYHDVQPDGLALSTVQNGVSLADASLDPVWAALDKLGATVFVHPSGTMTMTTAVPSTTMAKDSNSNSNNGSSDDGNDNDKAKEHSQLKPPAPLPPVLLDVAFETTRVATDLLYRRVLLRFPRMRMVVAHAGGVLPMLAGRLRLLGAEAWVGASAAAAAATAGAADGKKGVTAEEIAAQLASLFVDTAASAESGLAPALAMVGPSKVVYGADCGVPCSTLRTMEQNRQDVIKVSRALGLDRDQIGLNGWDLFPAAAKRCEKAVEL